jgi:acyl-CoA carboxylase subunit beta
VARQVLVSKLDPKSEQYRLNRDSLLAQLTQLEQLLAAARAGGGEKAVARHHGRGKLQVRERIELLVDRDAPFLELSPVAAAGTDYEVGASTACGIGVVSGVECYISGNDPTVRGGSVNPYTLRKSARGFEICLRNRLPHISLTESGGADLPRQSEIFLPGGASFRDLTQMSALGIPTISLVFGNSTAGGAYMPALCDYNVFVRGGAKVFLGGPPLVKMATGEESDDEELGGAEMHSKVSGLSDYLAADELDALRIGREIVANLNWKKLGPASTGEVEEPRYDARDYRPRG